MRFPLGSFLLAATIATGSAATASAQFQVGPVATNAYIVVGGLDWAWANPLPSGSGTFILSAQQTGFGWRLPTATELLGAPLATAFLFAGANVPFNGTDPISGAVFQATNGAYTGAGACATPWFSATYRHCDWQDGLGQPFGPWNGMPGANSLADQLAVRTDGGVGVVPEPATMSLLAMGLVGLVGARRRRTRV